MYIFQFILSTLLASTLIAASKHQERCLLESQGDPIWQQCDCIPVGANTALHIMCRHITLATIPPLPNPLKSHNGTTQNIVAISMTDGTITFIQQDAFKNQNIQTLDFSNNQIQTVNVNAFRTLEMKLAQLNLRENNLSIIPAWALTYLHQLQILHLENNRITHVRPNTFDETQLNSLQFLHLDGNQITFIPNLAFQRLRIMVLTLANNRIVELEKMSLPATIGFLDLRNNLLTQIPYLALKDVTELHTLNLEGNNITMLDSNAEVNFKSEVSLLLRNNKIRRLDSTTFRSFRKLKELDISYNQVITIHEKAFESVSHMNNLDLSYNSIAYIPSGTFKNFAKNLDRINLEANIIHTLPDALRDLHNLSYLNLNGNKLSSLNSEIMRGMRNTLTELLVAYNHLKKVPSEVLSRMEKLQHLDLSKNRIQSVERLAFGTHDGSGTPLMILNLAGNRITNITDSSSFLYLTSLLYLDLSHNRIQHIGPKAFEKLIALEKLFLQNNKLRQFPLGAITGLNRLRSMNLDGNEIQVLPPRILLSMISIEHLSLAHNRITHIDGNMFHSSSSSTLRTLNLGNNKISALAINAFSNLDNIQHIRLANNQLRIIPSSVFYNLKNLKSLDLSGNKIVQIQPRAISLMPSLDSLDLSNNKIMQLEKDSLYQIQKIEAINLSSNNIQHLNCSYLGSVSTVHALDLSNNELTDLDLFCMKRTIQKLNLASNNLQSIRREMMENFERLKEISLSNNGILEIQSHALETCKELTVIDLSQNHIKTIWRGTFQHQILISRLDLHSNALISVQRGSLGKNNLLTLDLSDNQLTRIPIEALETVSDSISKLHIGVNRIITVDASQFAGLNNMTRLHLNENRISSVEEAAFEHLTNLRHLDMSHNPISSWSPTAFKDLSHSIEEMNLADTGLFSLPQFNHRALRHVNISYNRIYELTQKDILPITKVATLDLSYNNLKTLDADMFEQLVDLKHLNISGNPIDHLNDELLRNLYQLESFYINDMPNLLSLPESSFSHMTYLRSFQMINVRKDCSFEIPLILRYLPPLTSLHIQINAAILNTQLHSVDKRILRELLISGNNITQISVEALHGLRGYKVSLTITNTSLRHFPSTIFNTLGSINYLSVSLANNQILTIDPFPFTELPSINQHGTILEKINIEGNPLECNCKMSWITEWVKRNPLDATSFQHSYCSNVHNSSLLSYFESKNNNNVPFCDKSNTGLILKSYFLVTIMIMLF